MANKIFGGRSLRFLRDFFAASDGNVAVIFTLAMLPIMAAIGVAVDYSRANSVRTAIQAAMDSTALMLSKDAQNLTADQLTQKANEYFAALFNRPEAKNVVLTTKLSSPQEGSFKLDLHASGSIDTVFLRALDFHKVGLGQKNVAYQTSSQVIWASRSSRSRSRWTTPARWRGRAN